jgi:hypothetical protein
MRNLTSKSLINSWKRRKKGPVEQVISKIMRIMEVRGISRASRLS